MIELFKYNRGNLIKFLPLILLIAMLLMETFALAAPNPPIMSNIKNAGNFHFRIDTPAVGHLYFIIFNGIASMFDSHAVATAHGNTYVDLLKLAFMSGGFVVFMMAVGKTIKDGSHAGLFDFLKYLVIGTMILFLMFGSKSTLIVESEVLPASYCGSFKIMTIGEQQTDPAFLENAYSGFNVSNFPTMLAWVFTTMNNVGYQLTKCQEQYLVILVWLIEEWEQVMNMLHICKVFKHS